MSRACEENFVRKLFSLHWAIPEKNPDLPDGRGFWIFSQEGGSKALEIQTGGGIESEKIFFKDHF